MELEESLESYTRGVELLKSLRTACPMPSRRSRCSLGTSTATTCSPTAKPPTPTTACSKSIPTKYNHLGL